MMAYILVVYHKATLCKCLVCGQPLINSQLLHNSLAVVKAGFELGLQCSGQRLRVELGRFLLSLLLVIIHLLMSLTNTSVTCDTFITCLAISVLFMCLYSSMSYYYLLRLSSFYFPDHCKCYLFSLVTPVYSVHV